MKVKTISGIGEKKMGVFSRNNTVNKADHEIIARAMRSPVEYESIRAEIVAVVAEAKQAYKDAIRDAIQKLRGDIQDERITALDAQQKAAEDRKAAAEYKFTVAIEEDDHSAQEAADKELMAVEAELRRIRIQRSALLRKLVNYPEIIAGVEAAKAHYEAVNVKQTEYLSSIDLKIWEYIDGYAKMQHPPMKVYDKFTVSSIGTSRDFRPEVPFIYDSDFKEYYELMNAHN